MKYIFTNQDVLSIDNFLSHEYLLTNGGGGYASSSLVDCHTRKYHGLLALPLQSTGRTYLLLSKLELSVILGSEQYDLSTNKFPGNIFPGGYQAIQSIEVDYFPVTTYSIADNTIVLKKAILMPRAENTVLVRYELIDAPRPITLKIAPFITYRDIHSLSRQNSEIRPRTYFETNGFKIDPYQNLPPLFLQTSKTSIFFPAPDWWKKFLYQEEQNRGYDYLEDLFSPGIFEVKIKKGESVIVRASLASVNPKTTETEWNRELDRIHSLAVAFEKEDEPRRTLKVQASHYIKDQPVGILAGFPWFSNEWGRDTFISLPGLLLTRGFHKEALAILKKYAALEKNGLLPNTISQTGDHSYNSIDAPFLFFWAVQRYLKYTTDKKSIETTLLPAMEKILSNFIAGKVPFAKVGEDGLLYAGNEKTQLTWMDAQVNGIPVTPRHGAAVEVNALFYNALVFVTEEFGRLLNRANMQIFTKIRGLFENNFGQKFWNEDDSCLIDVWRSAADRDTSIRPNQLFAIGLPHTCLEKDKAQAILDTVKMHLVTPFGLRTLSQRHELFIPVYEGDQERRDRAYHQGMIWPWLIGIYFDAMKKAAADARGVHQYFQNTFSPLWELHLQEGCLFHIAEIFTPVYPHLPKGCPAQAWSMAELIRVLDESKT
jgi:predicted glycogen debranching enzyme